MDFTLELCFGLPLMPLAVHSAVSRAVGPLGEAGLVAGLLVGCRKGAVPQPSVWSCPSPPSSPGWKWIPEKEGAVVTAAWWRSLSGKAGTRGHELHAGRLRLFSLIQGRKSLMSPDKSAKLDASVQWRYTTWHKEISFIFSYQPNVMIWERGEE